MTEDKSLRDELKELKEMLKDDKERQKLKKWRLPMRARLPRVKAKKGYTIVQYIKTNGVVDYYKVPIEENTVKPTDTIHATNPDNILSYRGKKPMMIVFEWNEQPLSIRQNYSEAEREKTLTNGQKYIFSRMKNDIIKDKKGINGKAVLLVLLLLAGGLWLARNQGWI